MTYDQRDHKVEKKWDGKRKGEREQEYGGGSKYLMKV